MNPFSSIFRRKQRPDRPRKRPARSLAMSFASLESRALLTIVGPIALPTTAALMAGPPGSPAPSFSFESSSTLDFGNPPSGGEVRGRLGGEPVPIQLGPADPISSDGQPFDRLRNHVALSAMPLTVNGITSLEIALANAGESQVRVRLGNQTVVLGAAQGIDHPQSVQLAYLQNSGIADNASPYPDLIVANSGGDNVLVFPGLPGGQFGPAINGLQGFGVGDNPVSVTIADINGDGVPDLLVANQNSNSISILLGQQGTGTAWNSNSVETINVGDLGQQTAPVKALYVDSNHDGVGVIVVCNSGSNNVYVYNGVGGGAYDTSNPAIFNVGQDPIDMLVDQFDRRSQFDLITLNSGSNDLTQIDGIFTSSSTTQTISSGGVMPDAAFAYPTGQNGLMGLVVANSGDGRLALLQPGNSGLQIAGIYSAAGLPIPTSLAASYWSGSGTGLEFIAATAGQDAADILRFNLDNGSGFLATPLSGPSLTGVSDGELIAGLMPYGDSSLELVAIFWIGSLDDYAISGEWSLREPNSMTALYSPTEGQGDDPSTLTADVSEKSNDSQANADGSQKEDPPAVKLLMTGDSQKLNATRDMIEALSDQDVLLIDPDASSRQIVRLEDSPFDPLINSDTESYHGSIQDAIKRLDHLEGPAELPDENLPITPSGAVDPVQPRREGMSTSAVEGQAQTVTLVSAVTLFSARLILKASPPRPPSIRRGGGVRIVPGKPETPPGV